MRKIVSGLFAVIMLFAVFHYSSQVRAAGQVVNQSVAPLVPGRGNPSGGLNHINHTLDDSYLEWPLPANDKQYGSIDGRELKGYVAELVAIPEKFRDQGHQFWGRITGSSADQETQDWIVAHLKAAGVSDVRVQPLDTPPQWTPTSWSVTATGDGKTMTLVSAQPMLSTQATPPDGLDLPAMYVGLGSEEELRDKDLKGKAVFIYSATRNHQNTSAVSEGAIRRVDGKGAAAIFTIFAMPGNVKVEFYNQGTHVPTFQVGQQDGYAVRDMILHSPENDPPHVKINLQTAMQPAKTANIWGTLPGTTDENVYIIAHRDGFFDGASDDGTGMASLIGLAEYFAKIPKEQRHRSIIFLATTGHHGNGIDGKPHVTLSGVWIIDHHAELFAKTALLINLEHTATSVVEDYLPNSQRVANSTAEPLFWFVRGSTKLEELCYDAYREFGVPIYEQPDPTPYGEIDGFTQFAPSIQLTNMGTYSHTDHETLDVIPWTGLESVGRAYAKIITEIDTIPIKDLQYVAPPRPAGGGGGGPRGQGQQGPQE